MKLDAPFNLSVRSGPHPLVGQRSGQRAIHDFGPWGRWVVVGAVHPTFTTHHHSQHCPRHCHTLTCFPFIVTVLSILRQAIGLQQSPPNMLMISLAMFLTYYVMEPVFTESWATGVRPYVNGDIPLEQAFSLSIDPFRGFMSNRIDPDTFQQLKELRDDFSTVNGVSRDAPLSLLVPSFLLSEVERAFQIGFLVFLPFLIIDLVVSAILMSMGMMMVPPAIVSLPFKLAFFVVSDGWSLLSSALVRSYF